jgi:fused signal recognition particle receptor
MDTGTILGIVAAVVVVGLIVWFFLRGKGQAPAELPPEQREKPARELAPKPAEKKAEPKKQAEPAAKVKPAEPKPEAPKSAAAAEVAASKEAEPKKAEPKKAEAKKADAERVEAEEPAPKKQAEPEPARKPEAAKPHDEDVKALKKGLASTRGGFIARLAKLFGKAKEIDPALLDEIQEVLLTADIGVKTSEKILGRLKERMDRNELSDEERVWEPLREEARAILATRGRDLDISRTPSVILVVGVNGVGKTTTIGKLASRYMSDGKKVVLAAGDTFRAAAVLQLEVWGRRVGCPVVKGKERADPASVIFDAVKKAKDDGADLVIADTAGRLHTKTNLMEELKKVVRTAEKALERPVDEILLVLDSTTGQNAIQQAQLFKEAIPVSGIALTKLDGTAKGGVILGIVDEHDLPVHFVGIGERVEDLREFDAPSFVEALFAKPDDESIAA